MRRFGIDVSRWQGDFNFAKAKKEGVEFVILRATYSSPGVANGGMDDKFNDYYSRAKGNGLPVGCYHYSMARNKAQALEEAKFLCSVLKGKQLEYPVWFDIEDPIHHTLGQRVCTDIVKTFVDYMRSQGWYCGVYSYLSFFRYNLFDGELSHYDHWVGQYGTACNYMPTSSLGMWQFGGDENYIRSNKIAGVVCDQDYCYKDYPAIIKGSGLNGFPKPIKRNEHILNGLDIKRKKDYLVFYTKGKKADTNKYGVECRIVNYKCVAIENWKGKMPLNGGWVLSGHGESEQWLKKHVKVGTTLVRDGNKVVIK